MLGLGFEVRFLLGQLPQLSVSSRYQSEQKVLSRPGPGIFLGRGGPSCHACQRRSTGRRTAATQMVASRSESSQAAPRHPPRIPSSCSRGLFGRAEPASGCPPVEYEGSAVVAAVAYFCLRKRPAAVVLMEGAIQELGSRELKLPWAMTLKSQVSQGEVLTSACWESSASRRA